MGFRVGRMATPLLAPDAQTPPVEVFFRTILRSGLLAPGQLREIMRRATTEQRSDATAAAEFLIKNGKLSRFQARKLLLGVTQGLVVGPYQILAPIGKGGQSIVYLARDSRSQQLLALKVLPPSVARAEERMLARFRREMELSRRVSHPAICWTQDIGVSNGVYWIAMEFIPGKSLYRLVNHDGVLTVARAARLFAEVTSGLEHAHGQGLIHRDLKPSNILVTPNDHAKILDLGLALMEGETAQDHTVIGGQGYIVGTMDYLAPEQADDPTRVDARADIYALGCTLYFALTGRAPFAGGDKRQKIQCHRREEPTPLEQLNPAVSADFAAIVRRMMAKRLDERFGSADQLRETLLRWTCGEAEPPPDRRDDTGYRNAMAALDTEAAWAELSDPPLPANPQALEPIARPPVVVTAPAAIPAPRWLLYAVPLGIAVFIGLCAAMAALCYRWLH